MSGVLKRSAIKIWFDVIFALLVRDVRTGFDDKFGISWAFIQPVAFILVLSSLRGLIDNGTTHSIPTFTFMACGLVLIQLFLQTFNATSMAINKSKPLFAFRQVQPISAVIATSLFELFVKIVVFFCVFIFMYLLGIEIRLDDPILALTVFFELWVFTVFVGLMVGITQLFLPEVKKLMGLLTRPLFFISGVFFSLQDIPKEYWYLLDWNPILHAVELFRFSLYSSYGDLGVSHSYLSLASISVAFLSLVLYQSFWKQAISQ